MTEVQKRQISTLRGKGKSYSAIAKAIGATAGSVKMYCYRNKIDTKESNQTYYCKHCGAPIHNKPNGRKAVFCSTKCRVQYWRKQKMQAMDHINVCRMCGKKFSSYTNDRKYCSHECYIKDRFEGGAR